MSELTDAQARAWCRSLEEQERSRLLGEEEFCRQAAVYFATTPEQCEERFALCRTEQYPSYREQQLASWECGTASRSDIVPGACEATLAEYEACFESTWEARKSFAANVSCEDPADFGSAPEVTAECSSLLARCPGLAAGAAD